MGKHRGNLGITAGFLVVALLMGNSSWAQTASDEFGITPGSTSVTFFAGVSNSSSSENKKFNLEANTGTPVGGRVAYNLVRTMRLSSALRILFPSAPITCITSRQCSAIGFPI
jgi:hypothetical protein